MAFLDKLGSLAKNLGDKTNEAIAMSKLNGKITSEKALAETELRKIGEYYYGQFLSGGQIEPEILEACQSAKAHYDEAAHAQLEIDRIRAGCHDGLGRSCLPILRDREHSGNKILPAMWNKTGGRVPCCMPTMRGGCGTGSEILPGMRHGSFSAGTSPSAR